MSRTFGVEIELKGITIQSALEGFREIGIACHHESYNHVTRSHWKIVPDGSIADGFEVVSPVLHDDQGIEQVRKVATMLESKGARVDQGCGLHVHFGANDLSVADVKKIVERYAHFEREIDAVMPPSRRGRTNRYCQSMTGEIASRIINAQSSSLSYLATNQPGRFFKVNLQSISRHGTIEIRHHSGSVDAKKITNWIRFGLSFIERSKALVGSTSTPMTVGVGPRQGSKRASILAQVRGGASIPEMAQAWGKDEAWVIWQVRLLNRDFGGEFKVIGRRNTVRHFEIVREIGQSAPAEAGTMIDASAFDGCPADVVEYYRNRTEVLARRFAGRVAA